MPRLIRLRYEDKQAFPNDCYNLLSMNSFSESRIHPETNKNNRKSRKTAAKVAKQNFIEKL